MLKITEQGSEEWFRQIAELLKDQLLGIELHDATDQDVTPPCQVAFLVPWHWDRIDLPENIRFIPGFRGSYPSMRGNGNTVSRVLFDFYEPLPYPSKEILEKVALDFYLTQQKDKMIGNIHFFIFHSPKLFE